jgi:MFS family permease
MAISNHRESNHHHQSEHQPISKFKVTWGVTLCCHAAVKSKEGLYAARFFLGLFEAGLFPGVILQLCYWYRPDEMSKRLLYFYILGNFSTVISGVLGYAFDGVSGKGGLSGWQWYVCCFDATVCKEKKNTNVRVLGCFLLRDLSL